MRPKFAILALALIAVVLLPFLSPNRVNAFSGKLTTCGLDNWDVQTALASITGPVILDNTMSFIITESSSNVKVYMWSSTNRMQITNYPIGNANAAIQAVGGGSYRAISFALTNRAFVSSVSTSSTQTDVTCIESMNNVDVSQYTTSSFTYPQFDFTRRASTINNTYNTTNNSTTTTGNTVEPVTNISQETWWNPKIIFGASLDNLPSYAVIKLIYQVLVATFLFVIASTIMFFLFKVCVWFLPHFWQRREK